MSSLPSQFRASTMSRRELQRCSAKTSPLPHWRPPLASSLLDAIYNSFNDSNAADHPDFGFVKRQSNAGSRNCRRDRAVDKWLEKQSVHGFVPTHVIFASISSDSSSSRIFFSSSMGGSSYRERSIKSTSGFSGPSVKQGRTQRRDLCFLFEQRDSDKESKRDIGLYFTKTKLKALKIYDELKKVKQPISPDGQISAFLNSIFTGNAKTVKI